MFTIDSLGRTLRISFHHNIIQEDGKPVRGSTRCTIEEEYLYDGGGFREISHGHSECYVGDQFNKAIGRKIALTRAMQNPFLGFSKATRTKIWKRYFELTKFPE